MPVHPVHPDPEELAAWQAGELSGPDGVRVEAHVAGCADCAGLVAVVERGRAALAGLGEAEPPPGLHERLAAAIKRETPTATGSGDGLRELAPPAEPIPLDGQRRRGRRSPARRRRVAVLTAAAAVILLVAGLVPVLRHVSGQTAATQGAGGGTATASKGSAEGSLPVFSAPDGYSGSALRSALAGNPAIRAAYQRAAGERVDQFSSSRSQPSVAAPQSRPPSGSTDAKAQPGEAARDSGGAAEPTARAPVPAGPQQLACVANARNRAGEQELRPAFFVDALYRGRPATILVTVRPDAPGQADLWAFPRGDCSASPFAHERVTVTPP